MDHNIAAVEYQLATVLFLAWTVGHSRLRAPVAALRWLWPVMHHVRQELAPFIAPLIAGRYLARVYAELGGPLLNEPALIGLAVMGGGWLLYRNDPEDDERWKRRRRRLHRRAPGFRRLASTL
ncbi:hypothetical protein [Winogradskya humida]|uniref:Uncharacterized protein n=1 Tax=Winogradskya humida TaxID=113566 RepID=A0ABQ4A791_9ACTN|nr:hypothetical protein [Actinoplanes humidus]GIE26718.1 hypothetical protein Ahu01nite_098200 [Actinoplanes humidus]